MERQGKILLGEGPFRAQLEVRRADGLVRSAPEGNGDVRFGVAWQGPVSGTSMLGPPRFAVDRQS